MARVSPTNNLKFTHPEIASLVVCIYENDWSVSSKTVEEVSAGSKMKAEFRCPKPELGHETSITTIKYRTSGGGCPVCSGKKVQSGINDLKTTHPELAKLIVRIYEKDGSTSNKTVEEVNAGSKMKAEFLCPKPELGHETSIATIVDRTRGGGCPVCAGKKVQSGINDLKTTHPEIASLVVRIYETDESVSSKTVEEVSAGSRMKAEFLCPKPELGHETSIATMRNRTKGHGCPVCSGHKVQSGINDLQTTHPEIASLVVRIYETDESVSSKTVEEVNAGSKMKAEFLCPKPELGHETSIAAIYNRTSGGGCPVCSGNKVQSGINDLQTTHPEIAKLIVRIYEKDGSISSKTVQEVSAGLDLRAEFLCPKPELGHETSIAMINKRTSGRGCPVCAGKKVQSGINDLQTTHPELAKLVVRIYENDGSISSKTVQEVSAGSGLKAEFLCPKPELGHETSITTINSRTSGTGCPSCATGKTEGLFRDSFNKHTNSDFISARIPLERESFKSGMIQVDMLSDELMLAIEYDGTWSHGSVRNPNKNITVEEVLSRDIESTVALIKAGYKVIRIREHSHYEKLPFIELPEEFAGNLHQVTHKSFGKDKTNIDSLVKKVIKAKQDWF